MKPCLFITVFFVRYSYDFSKHFTFLKPPKTWLKLIFKTYSPLRLYACCRWNVFSLWNVILPSSVIRVILNIGENEVLHQKWALGIKRGIWSEIALLNKIFKPKIIWDILECSNSFIPVLWADNISFSYTIYIYPHISSYSDVQPKF